MRDCYQCCFCQNMSGVMSSRCRVLVFIIIYFYSGGQVDGWRGPAQLYLAVSNEGWSKILGFVWTAAVLQKTTAELQKSSHSRMAPPSYLGTCCIVSCGCLLSSSPQVLQGHRRVGAADKELRNCWGRGKETLAAYRKLCWGECNVWRPARPAIVLYPDSPACSRCAWQTGKAERTSESKLDGCEEKYILLWLHRYENSLTCLWDCPWVSN